MIVPEILPGEFGAGYLIRLGGINGYLSKEITIENIRKEYASTHEDKDLSISILLSRALKISTEHFCRFHTLLPTLRSVTTNLPYMRHGEAGNPKLIKNNSHNFFGEAFNICECCISEDIAYHGFTYYRREHQLPGFNFCSKHLKRLKRYDCLDNQDSSPLSEVSHDAILRNRIITDSFQVQKDLSRF